MLIILLQEHVNNNIPDDIGTALPLVLLSQSFWPPIQCIHSIFWSEPVNVGAE